MDKSDSSSTVSIELIDFQKKKMNENKRQEKNLCARQQLIPNGKISMKSSYFTSWNNEKEKKKEFSSFNSN